jgi:hypothetical protein
MKKILIALLVAAVGFVGGCAGQQAAVGGPLAVLKDGDVKLSVNLPTRWRVVSDSTTPGHNPRLGNFVELRDSSNVANLYIFLRRTRNTLEKDLETSSQQFLGWYSGYGSTYLKHARLKSERAINVAGHNGILRQYDPVIRGMSRRVDVAVFAVDLNHHVVVCTYNTNIYQDPETEEMVLSRLSFKAQDSIVGKVIR